MANSEKRSINQCTYTPIVNSERVGDNIAQFVPKKPYLKMALMTTAMSEPELMADVLRGQETGNDNILRAVQLIHDKDFLSAAKALTNVSDEKVMAFSQDYLNQETKLIQSVETDLEKSIGEMSAPNTNVGSSEIRVERLEKEVGILKKAISTGEIMEASLAPMTLNLAKTRELMDLVPGKFEVALGEEGLEANESQLLNIDEDALQMKMSASAPQTASFLGKAGFFNFPKVTAKVANYATLKSLAFTKFKLYKIKKKKAQIKTIENMMKQEPVGYLHLERLSFTPVAYEQGELVYSLPMLPGETVRVSHREWSRTSSEYEKLVSNELETATEDALTEKSELSHSMSSEQQRNSAFNASASVSGGYGPVSVSASVGYNSSNSESKSRESSAKRSKEITAKASSRSKQEHKVKFGIATEYEVEDQTFREIKNEGEDAVRWDFHRVMKKWKIDLYRYDLRMTYDLVIPEPGSYLLRKYIELKNLKEEYNREHEFNLGISSIHRGNYLSLGQRYGFAPEAPPARQVFVSKNDYQSYQDGALGYSHVELELPDGYYFETGSASPFGIQSSDGRAIAYIETYTSLNRNNIQSGGRLTNNYSWIYAYDWDGGAKAGDVIGIKVNVRGRLSTETYNEWKGRVYEQLVDAAKANYEQNRQRLKRQIDELEAELYREDSLMLRKLEKEEIMKGVLRWIFGPDFDFYPSDLPQLSPDNEGDLEYYGKNQSVVDKKTFEAALKHGHIIRFLHQAIEWENVNYILYPYYWTDTARWDLKQCLYHPEYVHRSFLRSGACRVVLTIRPGFEASFLSFMETLEFETLLRADHPYMTVAEELKATALTKYPYTKDANPENEENRVDTWFEYTPTGAMDVVKGEELVSEVVDPNDDND